MENELVMNDLLQFFVMVELSRNSLPHLFLIRKMVLGFIAFDLFAFKSRWGTFLAAKMSPERCKDYVLQS